MRNTKIAGVLLFLLALFGCQETQVRPPPGLPAPPPGFTWIENSIGSFLKPDGWFEKVESKEKTRALFITREDTSYTGRFTVGMSINQVNSWSVGQTTTPGQFAKIFAAKIAEEGELLKLAVIEGSHPDMNVVRVRGNNNGVATIVHHIAIGMDSTDQVYLLTFEAPEIEWDEEIKKGGPMLNFFILGN